LREIFEVVPQLVPNTTEDRHALGIRADAGWRRVVNEARQSTPPVTKFGKKKGDSTWLQKFTLPLPDGHGSVKSRASASNGNFRREIR
jgi:hypothetical protein